MSIVCWLLGHKHDDSYISEEDTVAFHNTKDAVCNAKKIGTVNCAYRLLFCKRCKLVFYRKEVEENFR